MRSAFLFALLFFGAVGCGSSTENSDDDQRAGVGGSTATGGSSSSSGGSLGPGSGGTNTGGTTAGSGGAGSGSKLDTGSRVMSWVPPYFVEESKAALEADFGGIGMADGLSLLGLQFWRTNGASTFLDVTPTDIDWFVNWGRKNNVGILLCVTNHVDGDWNWPAAVESFKDNREAFVAHLLSEIDKYDLDGIDLDLEGIVDPTPEQRDAFFLMAQDLANGLHPQGKVVHMASFHGQWNAPNWNWWPGLLPIIDGIETMGYDQSGKDTDYETLVQRASSAPSKLLIGVPSWVNEWQGYSATEQLQWLVDQGEVGVAIWDASLRGEAWHQASIWQQLAIIKAR